MLTNWHMRPTSVDAAQPALEALEQALSVGSPYPLVITDANMPEMDGFDLIGRIREQPELAETAIMVLTSDGRLGDAARSRDLGVAAYLMKPVRQSNLLGAILQSAGKQPTDAGDPTQGAALPVPGRRHS